MEQLTLQTYRLLKKAKRVFMRTRRHPCVQELVAEGVNVVSFDSLYDRGATFEEVYAEIVRALCQELEREDEVVYAVPGHPLVAERSVRLLQETLAGKATVRIHAAVSFLDMVFSQIPLDPVEGLLVRDPGELRTLSPAGKEWLVIPQIYNRIVASEVKLDLMRLYPDEFEVVFARGLGTDGQSIQRVPLCELDHQDADHLSVLIVPPCPELPSLSRLAEIIGVLRSPEGCPWDREQDRNSLKKCLLEESYEVLEAIERQDAYNLCEELGDLLLQVVFHAQIASELQEFDLRDVLEGIIKKMIRRHPHVFADAKAADSAEVLLNWEEIKRQEKGSTDVAAKELFAGAARTLPALMLAEWTQKKAARVGFDWPDKAGPLHKIHEELHELEEALQQETGIQEEFGDVLFSLVNLARFLQLDPEDTLRQAVMKFQNRVRKMAERIEEDGLEMDKLSLEALGKYWDWVKTQEICGKIVYL
jgi:tetrapyrrole methylase family protein/MazG family protein